MHRLLLAACAFAMAADSAAAQQPRPATGFNFDVCYSRCLQLGGSPGACQPGCSDRAATLARIPPGAKRSPNDDPRSPRYHDAEPRRPAW